MTLVEGTSFCVSALDGDIDPGAAHGLFVQDTRILSRWRLLVDGVPVDSLSAIGSEPFEATFVGRSAGRAQGLEPTVVVERHRLVAHGMREDVTLRNHGLEAAAVDVELEVESDFADLFEVKDGRHRGSRPVGRRAVGSDLVAWLEGPVSRGVRVSAQGAVAAPGRLRWSVVIEPGQEWTTTVEVVASVDGDEIAASFPLGAPVASSGPVRRMQGWRDSTPEIRVDDPALAHAIARSQEDLGALRIVDPEHPEDDVVAAGAPWFMALFGRDSLLTGWMTLPFAPGLALGTLRTLARLQGTRDDARSEEQPGKILHEVRLGADLSLALGGQSVYYGSVDATPLFVMLVGQAARWGASREEIEPLVPAVDAALAWILEHGDVDGDGFVEYARRTDRGLLNQGWKDSGDAMVHADGALAAAPIALAEVQGYVHAAYRARAFLAEHLGRPEEAAPWRARADALRRLFHEAYWLPELGTYAMALDRDKRPLAVVSSNVGHCLWTGIVDDAVADTVVERLLAPDMFTGFGIRTLGSGERGYNPVSYHRGSVWPHDTVLAAAGMAAYGRRDAATRVTDGLVDAASAFDGRLPELFCGFDRHDKPVPVPYPTSCSPQAWAAAVPFEVLRISLDLEPGGDGARVSAGHTEGRVGTVRIDNLAVGDDRLSVSADEAGVDVG
ncbi:amylo-alpha-1,6-glucosidase [Xylanimonas oleitrophica]|uniref:Amylo-alpha-1,6-glucosidase n=2 Tax=Xylanimonas oleitrophica TaxID=2607479 RepID=A0A2W5X244_9MICO|nr:amylo-alpha-1,6-glucosidase [Xylanimonas oleitrophica]